MKNLRYLIGYFTGASVTLAFNTYCDIKIAQQNYNERDKEKYCCSLEDSTYYKDALLVNVVPIFLVAFTWPISIPFQILM